jgi:hypothetical protein
LVTEIVYFVVFLFFRSTLERMVVYEVPPYIIVLSLI